MQRPLALALSLCLLGFAPVLLRVGKPLEAAEPRPPEAALNAAIARTAAEMQPYAQRLAHTETVIEMVPIPGGTFLMGSPASETGRREHEGPQHHVRIDPFWMGKYEVTWDQYDTWGERIDIIRRDLAGLQPTAAELIVDGITRPTEPYTDMSFGFGKGNYPAISMTQHAARAFCQWLTAKTGLYYRLPTEAEWEYACRAGTTTAYSFGDDPAELDAYAVYGGNSDEQYAEVGTKRPNPWGLHDMHGNVSEWVLDQYVPDSYARRGAASANNPAAADNPLVIPTTVDPRVVRGGGWDNDPALLRSAARIASDASWKQQDPQLPQSIWYLTDAQSVGFRVVRPLREPTAEERAEKWDKSDPPQLDQ